MQHELLLEKVNEKKYLGQVFTPAPVADFMLSLFSKSITKDTTILDPCIGPNTFFSLLDTSKVNPHLTGVEIDSKLINASIKQFYQGNKRNLISNSFFNHPLSKKYDYIIQNPPYVRQELLNTELNSKDQILESIGELASLIPSQSNLYVYFLVKSILHLKEGGQLIAIIYDSWLYSSFGKCLRNIFTLFGHLKTIYHVKDDVFPDAEVGATIIVFQRKAAMVSDTKTTKYYNVPTLADLTKKSISKATSINIPEAKLLTYSFNEISCIDFGSTFFKKIKELSSKVVQRGTSSVANGHFLHTYKRFKESVPLVKDISKIKQFAVTEETSYLLAIEKNPSPKTDIYLQEIKLAILDAEGKFEAVKKKIKTGEKWYKINFKKKGNFIFNYYMRNNVDFIYNPNLLHASDNFYIVNIEDNPLAYLAILNSTFTKIALLLNSRNQGNGLRKVQLYEFNEVPIIDIGMLSLKAARMLEKYGEALQTQNRYENKNRLLKSIDKILLIEYNKLLKTEVSLPTLENELKKNS